MPKSKKKPKDTTSQSEPVKLQVRNINKSTKAIFEYKKKKSSGTEH